jgi:DNA-binding transcriptional MerR regulator
MAVQDHELAHKACTLQDAAHELGISVKTLRRWADLEGMHPAEDPHDRRRRLISHDELGRLKQLCREVPSMKMSSETTESRLEALERQVSLLETALAAVSNRSSATTDNIILLTQQVLELQNSQNELLQLKARVS